jgi:hypothetical protein
MNGCSCKQEPSTELLGLGTFFPSSGILENTTFRNWFCFRPQVKVEKTPTQLGPLERDNLNHWTPVSDLHSYLIIWDQAVSAGDNKKLHNKNCDEAPTCVELG